MLRSHRILAQLCVRPYSAAAVPAAEEKSDHSRRVITCKRKEFNLTSGAYRHAKNPVKFGTIPLASKTWTHRKAKGDFFILHPIGEGQGAAPDSSFVDLGITGKMAELLQTRLDIQHPTAFQVQAIPKLSNNEHVLLAAETGCGKTLAYLLPILENLKHLKDHGSEQNRRFNTPLALILTPGRELATQIGAVARQLGTDMGLQVSTILGGNTKKMMMNPTFDDVDILVGSMGAISKLVTTGIYRMERVRHVVLDEADTLLDDSFNEKLSYFMKRFPFHKNLIQNLSPDIVGTQLVLASATMPNNYRELFQTIVDPDTIKEIRSPHLHHLPRHVPQRFFRLNKSDRPAHLMGIVKSEVAKKRPVIVFSNRTPTADFVSIMLNEAGVECLNLTGDMQMAIREGRFEQFQGGQCNVLSTTDVGSRGLDTSRAAHVINFDFPLHIADYIHRCGRVGRVGSRKDAQVTNFVSSGREMDLVQKIEHAARTGMILQDVDANITNIIKKRILKNLGEVE